MRQIEIKKLRILVFAIVLLCLLLVFIAIVFNDSKVVVVHYSDAHIGSTYIDELGRNSTERYKILINALNNLDFDFAVDTGDLIDGANCSDSSVWDIFDNLKSQIKYHVYYTMGNHDWTSTYGRGRWLNATSQQKIEQIDIGGIRLVFFSPEEWVDIGLSDPLLSNSDKSYLEEYLNTDKPVFLFTHAHFDYWNETSYTETVSSQITFLGCGHNHVFVKPWQDDYISSIVPSVRVGSFETHHEIYFNRYTISGNTVLIEVVNAETLDVYYSSKFAF